MADTDTMKFGPQWLRQLSDGGGNVYSPPPTPVANLGHFGKFKMADYRYGKEEILALYQPRKEPPECLKRFSEILCEDGPQNPVSVGPLSEDEQRLLMHGVNSNQVYRMMSSTHRGTSSQPEVGAGDAGVGRGGGGVSASGGGSGGGASASGGGAAVGAGRGGRGRGARRTGEAAGEVGGGGETEAAVFSRGPPAPGVRTRGGRGGGGPGENPNPGRGNYRGRGDAGPPGGDAGDSNGDWRRVSRQRFPSESDTDWRRGPRTGGKEGAPSQRATNSGGAGGGRVGGGSTRSSGAATKGNDSSGSWRQRPNNSSDQRHFGASPGGGRGRGMGREKGSAPRPDSEEEIPEWVNDENGRDESGTGFFDSSGSYKPTVGRGSLQRSYRARQTSSGSSGGGSFTRNNDSEDYWEDDWETEFELYDGLDGSRQEAPRERHSPLSNEDPEEEPQERSEKMPEPPGVGPRPASPQAKAAAVRPSVLEPRPDLNLADSGMKTNIAPTPSTPMEQSVAGSLQNTGTRWFYRDPQGRNQGPFTAAQMQEWFQAGFFDLSLSVRRACDQNFSSLESYFKAHGSQTFVGTLAPNALSPVSPDPSTLHLMLQQRQLALLLKQQQQQQQQQPQAQPQCQSPEKMAAGLVSPNSDMILLNMLLLQQQLINSGVTVPDAQLEQIEALKRQQTSFAAKNDPKLVSPASNEASHFPVAVTNTSPVDAGTTPSTQWPVTSTTSVPSSGSGPPEAQALWQQQQMAAMREELERQQEQQQRAKLLALEAEEAELQRRRQEVEERERRLAAEEAERQELARRQEAERLELDRRRLEVEELEKMREAEKKLRWAREAELKRLEEEAETAAAAAAAAEAEAALKRQVEAEREMAARKRLEEQQRDAAERKRRQQEEKEAAERRAQQLEEQKAQEEQQLDVRRRQQEEEARRVQLNKFQLPGSARWASAGDGASAPGLNLLEIQRVQQQKDEEEAQEARAMRLEREAAKLCAQRHAQLGPWNVGGGGASSAPAPAITPTGRQKSFMEIQAEEQAREEMGVRNVPPTSKPAPSAGSGASIWGSNWSSKVQQPPAPSAPAANRAASSKAPAAQPVKGRSVWNYTGQGQSAGAKLSEAKGFPGLGASEGQKRSTATQQPKKKGASAREEERVNKLFSQGERSGDNELTRWCKAAIDRVACPTTLDKAMFVEYLISMETAADIEEMMGAYHCEPNQTKKFVAEFLEKRRQFRKAIAEGTDIVLPFTDNFSKGKEDEFQKVGSSNKTGGNKRNRKKKAQKVSNLLSIKSTGDPDRVNVGEIDFAD